VSEIALTLLRLGFLALLWIVVLLIIGVMRRDFGGSKPVASKREAVKPNPTPDRGRPPKISRLRIITEDGDELLYPLSDGMTLGRADNNSIWLEDDYASGLHARISLDDGTWWYEDLDSTNGSWVGRKRLTAPLKIKAGTDVTIGRTTLRFEK
jgi:pSer/pThr/pTyr-binding forkhead associated (FHA) protein